MRGMHSSGGWGGDVWVVYTGDMARFNPRRKRPLKKNEKKTIVKQIDIPLSHSRLNGLTTTTSNAVRRLAKC